MFNLPHRHRSQARKERTQLAAVLRRKVLNHDEGHAGVGRKTL